MPGQGELEPLRESISCIREDVAKIKAEQRTQGERVVAALSCVYGTGDSPGIKVRVDRLEQDMFRRAKFFWGLVAAVFGLVAKEFSTWFHK